MGEEAGLRMPIRLSPGLEERQALTKSPGKVHTSASSRHVCDRSSRIQEVQGQTWMEVWKKHQNAEKRCLPNLATWKDCVAQVMDLRSMESASGSYLESLEVWTVGEERDKCMLEGLLESATCVILTCLVGSRWESESKAKGALLDSWTDWGQMLPPPPPRSSVLRGNAEGTDGKFGAYMQVHIQNDGPVTIELESPAPGAATSDPKQPRWKRSQSVEPSWHSHTCAREKPIEQQLLDTSVTMTAPLLSDTEARGMCCGTTCFSRETRCGSCWTAEPWTTHSPRRGAGRAAGKGCLPAEVEKCDALKQQLRQAVETRAQDLAWDSGVQRTPEGFLAAVWGAAFSAFEVVPSGASDRCCGPAGRQVPCHGDQLTFVPKAGKRPRQKSALSGQRACPEGGPAESDWCGQRRRDEPSRDDDEV
ncbi:hypothetical protein CB1_000637009 [Camelus ferus]|nr:hypothetical protein CB1_000637009 [Camelus ferus]